MRRWWLITLLLILALAHGVEASGPSDVPPQLYLPARHFWQSRNNCGPTAVAMAVSIFGVAVDPDQARWALRPEPESIGMDPSRVPAYVKGLGLMARPRVNGEIETLRRLVAADVPVLVTQWLSTSMRLEHYRLVVGYDMVGRRLLVHDSTLGPYVWLSEGEFQTLWAPTGRAYIPVYRPFQEATVASLIGRDWDDTVMYRRAYDRAVDEVWGTPNDPWVWARLGFFAYSLGDPRTALTAWQNARFLNLPQGEYWLPAWMSAAALDLTDFATALNYADQALKQTPSSPGLYYIRGRALQALGQTAEAAREYRRAVELEPSFAAARAALDSVSR